MPAARSDVPRPVGIARAARSTTRWSRARTAGSAESPTRNTTVNAPSLRSPNRCWSTDRTCSASVPGTVKTFDCSAESWPEAQNPTTATATHATTIGQRSLIALVDQP